MGPYAYAADMWSLGCVCAELVLGRSLFPHHGGEEDIVRCITDLLGDLPEHMLKAGRNTNRYFWREDRVRRGGRLSWLGMRRSSSEDEADDRSTPWPAAAAVSAWKSFSGLLGLRGWSCPTSPEQKQPYQPQLPTEPAVRRRSVSRYRLKSKEEPERNGINSLDEAVTHLRYEILRSRACKPRR